MVMANIQIMLDELGITFKEIVKIVKYYTEPFGRAVEKEFYQGWIHCSTTLSVANLPGDGIKVLFDVTAVIPKKLVSSTRSK